MKQLLRITLLTLFVFIPLSADKVIGNQIYIKSGTYFVGNDKERDNSPLRAMQFKGFYIDTHPVTNGQYIHFIKKSQYHPKGSFNLQKAEKAKDLPATGLVYDDALAYAAFFNKRLPSEWEWEIAARSLQKNPEETALNTRNRDRGHFYQSKVHSKSSVFKYPPNDLGIYGMAGNVYEWTSSRYEGKYLIGKFRRQHRVMVIRGGSWTNNFSDIRTTTRTPFPEDRELKWLGFRCVSNGPGDQNKSSSPDNK